jgi:hypothetical protein
MEAEAADVVSYLLVGLACSCTRTFYLNQTCQTYPIGTDITQVVKNRYSSGREAIAPAFSADVYTNGCDVLSVKLDLLVETFLIGFDGNHIIIASLNN